MALVDIPRGALWFPGVYHGTTFSLATTTYLIDAESETAELIFKAPKTGNIDKFAIVVATVANAPDNGLRFSLQGVSLTTGIADGTFKGATNNAKVTVASGSVVTGWLDSGNFGEVAAVTRNELLAAVLDFPTFVDGDSVTIQAITLNLTRNFPYGVVAGTKQASAALAIVLHYDDGTWFLCAPSILPAVTATTVALNTASTPDEAGLSFTPNFPCKVSQCLFGLTVVAAANFDIVLYDSANNVLATESYDGDVVAGTGARTFGFIFDSDITLAAGSLYRLVVKPTTANNVSLAYITLTVDGFGACPGGTAYYMTQRVDAGTWTNFNNGTDGYRRPYVFIGASAVDDGAGGAGGKHSAGMRGGFVN